MRIRITKTCTVQVFKTTESDKILAIDSFKSEPGKIFDTTPNAFGYYVEIKEGAEYYEEVV